jgi:hypothetical protein
MSNRFLSLEHPAKHIEQQTIIGEVFRRRGFLPASDPLTEFPRSSNAARQTYSADIWDAQTGSDLGRNGREVP